MDNLTKCTFCNREDKDVDRLFYSKTKEVVICNLCLKALHNHSEAKSISEFQHTPRGIYKALKEYVVGQDESLKEISIVLFKHLLQSIEKKEQVKAIRSSLLMVGPTGSGKTFILDVAAKLLNVPVLIVDCTALTAAGYVGDDIEQMLGRLVKKAGGNLSKAEQGIIFLDEIDKIAKKESQSNAKDIGGEAVQQELLRALEGSKIEFNLDSRKPYVGKTVSLDTSNMLFVAGGCFDGIDKMMKKHTQTVSPLLSVEKKFKNKQLAIIIRDSLVQYGIIPELSARFSTITMLRKLTKEHIQDLIRSNRGRIKGYLDVLNSYNIQIELKDSVYDLIADYAHKLDIGARGINYVADRIFNHYLFNIEEYKDRDTIVISATDAENIMNSFWSVM